MLIFKGLIGLLLSVFILWVVLMILYNVYLFLLSLYNKAKYKKDLLYYLSHDLTYYKGKVIDFDLNVIGYYTSDSIQTDYTGTIYRADHPKIFKALESTLKD